MSNFERLVINSLILIVILTFILLGLSGCIVIDFERGTVREMKPDEVLVLPDADWNCIQFGRCTEENDNGS